MGGGQRLEVGLGEFIILLSKDVSIERIVLLLDFERSFVNGTLLWISQCSFGISLSCFELVLYSQLRVGWFFSRRVAAFAREYFTIFLEEVHVGVAADFATHGLNESHRFDL